MNQLPFSVYDFFGYLASGAVLLAAAVASFHGAGSFGSTPSLPLGFLLVIVIYVLGQIVANLAGDLIERRIVRGRLGTPTAILLGERTSSPPEARFFPGYFRPLPVPVAKQVKERAGDRAGEALFFHCHARMKSDSVVQGRLETFLNLYGFCRNMMLAALLSAACLLLGILIGSAETGLVAGPGWWLALSLLAAVGLFYRYLKFYRQYALELFTAYAETELSK